jgi:hypothetical protein
MVLACIANDIIGQILVCVTLTATWLMKDDLSNCRQALHDSIAHIDTSFEDF